MMIVPINAVVNITVLNISHIISVVLYTKAPCLKVAIKTTTALANIIVPASIIVPVHTISQKPPAKNTKCRIVMIMIIMMILWTIGRETCLMGQMQKTIGIIGRSKEDFTA